MLESIRNDVWVSIRWSSQHCTSLDSSRDTLETFVQFEGRRFERAGKLREKSVEVFPIVGVQGKAPVSTADDVLHTLLVDASRES